MRRGLLQAALSIDREAERMRQMPTPLEIPVSVANADGCPRALETEFRAGNDENELLRPHETVSHELELELLCGI